MTAEKLLAEWPDCRHAVAWTELFLSPAHDDGPEGSGLELLAGNNVRPDKARDFIRELIRDQMDAGECGKLREALAEVDSPAFLTYLAGRLGCC